MSDKIGIHDLFDDGFSEQLKRMLDPLITGLKQSEAIVKSLAKTKDSLQNNPLDSSSSIRQHQKDLIDAQKLANELTKQNLTNSKLMSDAAKQKEKDDRAAIKSEQEKAKAMAAANKEIANQNSEYKKMSDRLRDVKKEIKDLVVVGKPVTAELAKEFIDLDEAVRLADAKVGEFGRNVGNYQGKFNGLGNSVNQLTREMPAFANSMQTGFMAISNNLPIFFDEIKRTNDELKAMQAEGKKAPSLFSAIAGSIFTWGTALSIGVTLLTVFGKELVNAVASLFKADEAFKISTDKQKEYNQVFLDLTNARIESILKLAVLQNKMSQKDVDDFKAGRAVNLQREAAERRHAAVLIQIMKDYNTDIDKLTGELPETAQVFEGGIAGEFKTKAIQENININKAVLDARALFYKELADIRKTADLAKAVSDAEASAKDKSEDTKNKDESIKREKEYTYNLKKELQEKENASKEFPSLEEGPEFKQRQANLKNYIEERNRLIKEGNEFEKNQENQRIEDQKKAQEKEKQILKDHLNALATFIERSLKARSDLQTKQINNDIEMRQRNIIQQQQLAAQGYNNTLAFEKAALAKDELRKQQQAEKDKKREKEIAFYKYLAAYVQSGQPDQAISKTIVQMALAGAIAGSFFDGAENVAEDLKGNKMHGGRDGYVIAVDGSERIFNGKQNAMIPGGMSNDEAALILSGGYLPKYMTDNSSADFAENAVNSMLLMQFVSMNEEIKGIKDALKNRPATQTIINKDGIVSKKELKNGLLKVTTQKQSSPLNMV